MRIRITLAALIAACGIMVIPPPGEAQQMAIGPSTAAQAQAGRAAYQGNCGACHAPDLSGREGPQLAGANFMSEWGARTAGELIGFMRATMPPGAGGSLPDQTYVNLAAFILDANSARPGERTLTADSAVTIGSSGQSLRPIKHRRWGSRSPLKFQYRWQQRSCGAGQD